MNLDLEALETSFDVVAPRGEELVDEFYSRLFEAAPAVMPLFADTDLQRQKKMLLARSSCCASRCATSTRSSPNCGSLVLATSRTGRSPSTIPLSETC